jgi:alpha-aminoadipic semialdehyde synthase
LKSSLYDYELLSDAQKGQRLVAFGKYAGYSGMIMALHGVGLALLQRGIKSSFLVKFSCMKK